MNKKCETFVIIISWIICFTSVWICTYGFLELKWDIYRLSDINPERLELTGTPGYFIIVVGNLSFLTGIMGCITAKFKRIVFLGPFFFLSFVMVVLLLVGAALAIGSDKQV